MIFGRLTKADLRSILDLSPREIAVFAPLAVLTLWMGVYPSSFTSFFDASVAAMVQQHTQAMAGPTTHVAGVADAVKLAQAVHSETLHSGMVPHR
jgi:NADH-quinone oxidoreductase subunit M